MNKNIRNYKINEYDKFKCIADKCKFTCCAGWDINVDESTYNKWENSKGNCGYILAKVIPDGAGNYLIDKNTSEGCPFLDENKLCIIVKEHGDDYLSATCRSFPRINNELDNVVEKSLSCGCPEVLEIIDSNNNIHLLAEDNSTGEDEPIEKQIRNTLMSIENLPWGSIPERLMVSFRLVQSLYDMDEITMEEVVEVLDNYQKDPISFVEKNKGIADSELEVSLKEVNKLFLDMIENYKRVSILKETLKDPAQQSYKMEQKIEIGLWEQFIINFGEYDGFINKCISLKIINSCLNEDLGEILISIQLILLEYVLVRYASYLGFIRTSKVVKSDIKDYIVIFSRIIENNIDAVLDYFYERYNEEILEPEYLRLISCI